MFLTLVNRNIALVFTLVAAWFAAVLGVAQETNNGNQTTTPPWSLERLRDSQSDLVTVRAITRGPSFHWFGYYDKHQFDPTGRYVLGMEVDFDHRSPRPDDVVKIGIVDLEEGDRWIELGESRAWCWQQGCMLQWRPGSESEILWNDRDEDRFVCRLLDVETRDERTIPHAIYHVSPDGKWGLGLDFARSNDMDAGYGYVGIPDSNADETAPEESTIYRVDLDSGERVDLISVADIAGIDYPDREAGDKHYFNHIQWSPDGERFLFLNRWNRRRGGRETRMFTAAADGSDLRLINFGASHFEWRDPANILVWTNGAYRLFADEDGPSKGQVVWKSLNGHQSYLPGKDWLITDTYPQGPRREQYVYLHHEPTGRDIQLGAFASPPAFKGEWRCDTHPRLSRDGTKIIIDSPHGSDGRQMYLIDIGAVLAEAADVE